jgi:molybdate transport system substrate-binding protein
MFKNPRKRASLGLLIALLSLVSLLLAACGDPTATSAPPATTAAATTAAATTAAATTVAATTSAATTAASTTSAATTTATTNAAATTAAATTVASGPSTTASGELVVFAASSLTDSFNQIKADLEKANAGLKITYNFGGSNTLRAQLEQGAKADIFASANQTEMDNALKSNLVADKGATFARNRLVVILPKSNPAKIQTLQDLGKSGVKFVTAQKDVPVGGYTLQALDKMSKDPAFGADFSQKVQANFVSQESNVKQVVAKVQLGEADAGVCYLSDISPSVIKDLTTLEIPDQFNTLATYPISVLKSASNPAAAKVFLDYVLGEKGQAILKANNFIPFGGPAGAAKQGL